MGGIIGFIFRLIFKRKGNHQSSNQLQQTSNDGGDRIQLAVAKVMERQVLSAAAATELLNSEFVRGKLNETVRERIEQAIEKAGEAQGGNPATASNQTTPGQQVTGNTSAPSAWRPDAITTGDANWHPDAEIKGEDPWHPDAGTKRNDPWHPDAGSKKNDPWHPGD